VLHEPLLFWGSYGFKCRRLHSAVSRYQCGQDPQIFPPRKNLFQKIYFLLDLSIQLCLYLYHQLLCKICMFYSILTEIVVYIRVFIYKNTYLIIYKDSTLSEISKSLSSEVRFLMPHAHNIHVSCYTHFVKYVFAFSICVEGTWKYSSMYFWCML
jgi:hypothetical protein